MTTYLGDKAVGIGTVKAEIGVTGIVLHDETLVGNGNTEPLGVNTANIVSQQTLANTVSVLNTAIDAQADAISKTRNDFEIADQNIRADMNAEDSRLQTQITAQAGEIAKLDSEKIDKNQGTINAGKYLMVGDDGIVGLTESGGGGELPDNVLVNKPNGKPNSLVITPDYDSNYGTYNVSIGAGVVDSRNHSVHIGYNSLDYTTDGGSVGIGSKSKTAGFSVAIGYTAEARAQYSIQIGGGENKDANTLKVSNANGNFEMMSADGTIPLERLTKVTDQIGDISTALTAILGE